MILKRGGEYHALYLARVHAEFVDDNETVLEDDPDPVENLVWEDKPEWKESFKKFFLFLKKMI